MSGYTSVLIAGATGYVGEKIVKAFLKASPKWIVYVLTSSAPKTPVKQALFDSFIAQGAHAVTADTEGQYKDVLKGIDVVVSAIAVPALPTQTTLAKAAKEAGVKLFVPSEFGLDCDVVPSAFINAYKTPARREIEQLGINCTYIVTGLFYEYLFGFLPWGYDLLNKKITIIGDPSTKLSAASINEVADLLPAIVNDPTSINAKIVFEGQHATIGDLAAAALDLLGQDQVEVQRVPIEEIQHRIDSNSNPFATIPEQVYLQLALGNTYNPNTSDGSKYGKKLSTFKEFLPGFLKYLQEHGSLRD